MITFKKYVLLNEWTRELMPEIYAALEKYDDPMVGVHFTKGIPERYGEKKRVPHIGLNLHPFHQDPIGIYAFPKDYVLSGQLEANSSFTELTNYYIVKPSLKANILNLSKMTDEDAINILRQMGVDENEYKSADIYHKSGKMEAGHRFWGTLEKMRKKIYGDYDKNLSWNKLFKKTPYNVLYDEGGAIIHNNEPSQIVYLDSSAMEVLDQGKQDDPVNKVYSFFIENFPELRPQKTKDHWGAEFLKLHSKDGYTLKIYPPSYEQVKIQIYSTTDYDKHEEFQISLNNVDQSLISGLKNVISKMDMKPDKESEPPVHPVLESISKRFNIKLKKVKTGDWEIRQRYQDSDKDYVITFYIRQNKNKNEMYFILDKRPIKKDGYAPFDYTVRSMIEYKENVSPEELISSGLIKLIEQCKKLSEVSSFPSNYTYAMKTIEFLRKRVFGL
jgi:hypothetical protein